MEPCDKSEERICAKKKEGISIIKKGKKESEGVYKGTAKEGIYMTVKVTTDSTGCQDC